MTLSSESLSLAGGVCSPGTWSFKHCPHPRLGHAAGAELDEGLVGPVCVAGPHPASPIQGSGSGLRVWRPPVPRCCPCCLPRAGWTSGWTVPSSGPETLTDALYFPLANSGGDPACSLRACVCLHTPRHTSAFAPLPNKDLESMFFFLEIIDNESLRVQGFLSAGAGGGWVQLNFICSVFLS